MPKNKVAIIGLDAFNKQQLEDILEESDIEIVAALTEETLKSYPEVTIEEMLEQARKAIQTEKAEGLTTWWDFPGTLLQAVMNDEKGFFGMGLIEDLKCEHKYWSRTIQQMAAPEVTPRFCSLDPFQPQSFEEIKIETPFWIKPIKSTASMLGFKIENKDDYNNALGETRKAIHKVGKPFNDILKKTELPDEIEPIDGNHCLIEESCTGTQHTVSGYVYKGEVTCYGLIDSINYKGTSSFLCYAYPSRLGQPVRDQAFEASKKIIREIGLDNNAFNIEYFYDHEKDVLSLLEVNPRISQSHSNIYHKVDGQSNERFILDLALGRKPDVQNGAGKYNCAAKFYYRRFEDGLVTKVPTQKQLNELQKQFPELLIKIESEEGKCLSEMKEQDSYSYVLAIFFLGGDNYDQLLSKYESVTKALSFDIERV